MQEMFRAEFSTQIMILDPYPNHVSRVSSTSRMTTVQCLNYGDSHTVTIIN